MTHESPPKIAAVAVVGEGEFARAVASQVDAVAPADADVVVIDAGDDGENIALANSQTGRALVAIRDRGRLRALHAKRETSHAFYVSPADLAADHALGPADLAELAYWRGQSRVHAAILGFGPLAEALFERVTLDGIAGRFDPPRISLMVEDEAAVSAWLAAEMPEIGSSVELSLSRLGASLDDPAKSPLLACDAQAPLTAILAAPHDDAQAIAWATALARLKERTGRPAAAIVWAGPGAAAAAATMKAAGFARGVSHAPGLDAIPDLVGYCLTRRDALARRLHGAYTRLYGNVSGEGPQWHDIAETYRRANRRAARHLATKLWTLGFSPAPHALAGGIEPSAFATVLQPLAASAIEDDTMRRLARIEHDRWSADRRLDGWRYGQERDDAALCHPSLIPFDDPRLSAYEIGKDIAQIAFLLGEALTPHEKGLARRVVVGVLGKAPVQAGVSPSTAAAWLNDNPQREPVLLSPLATRYEVAETAHLLANLPASTKLVVITAGPDLQPSTDAAELLARTSTVLAPLAPVMAAVSEPDEIRAAKHIARCADLLVTP